MASSVVSRGLAGGLNRPPPGPVRAGSFGGNGVRDIPDHRISREVPLAPRISSQSYGSLHRERGASEGAQRYRGSSECREVAGMRPGLRPEGLFPSFDIPREDRSTSSILSRRPGQPPLLPHPPSSHSFGHWNDERTSSVGDNASAAGSGSHFRRPHTPSGMSSGCSAHAPIGRANGPGGGGVAIGMGRESQFGSRSAGEASARSLSAAATPSHGHGGSSNSSSAGGVTCDKCDGRHQTDLCPHYKGVREKHKDAWANYGVKGKTIGMGANGGNFVLRSARVVRQPGDGSCLFHSMNYGLGGGGGGAMTLRREIASFLEQNPHLQIAGDTLEDWVKWDANSSVSSYARRMSTGGWGGGIEMACCSKLKNVNIHVYENRRGGGEYKRISCFDSPSATKTVHVLYQGGVHYDALVPS